MKEYVFDANAILRYFRVVEAEGGDKVQEIFDLAKRAEAHLLMSVVNFGEGGGGHNHGGGGMDGMY